MFLLFALGAVIALCALLWRVAVYALPVFVGFSTAWWALNHGAGVVSIILGFIAGALTLWLGRAAAISDRVRFRWLAIAAFVAAAAYAGFGIVNELGQSLSSLWRILAGAIGAMAVAGTTYARLTTRDWE